MPFHSIFYSTQWYQSNQACKPGWVFFACFLFLCLPAKYIFGLTVLKFLGHLVYGFYNSFVIAASAVCNHCLPRAKLAKYFWLFEVGGWKFLPIALTDVWMIKLTVHNLFLCLKHILTKYDFYMHLFFRKRVQLTVGSVPSTPILMLWCISWIHSAQESFTNVFFATCRMYSRGWALFMLDGGIECCHSWRYY